MKLVRTLAAVAVTLTFGVTTTTGASAEAIPPNFSKPTSWSGSPQHSSPDDSQDAETSPLEDSTSERSFKATGNPGSCRLVVWDIGYDRKTNGLGVQGGRENCSNPARFSVQLKKDLNLRPDPVYGKVTGNGNQILIAYTSCQGHGNYYGFVQSSTGTSLRGDNYGAC